jgi:hypothetical protein
MNMKYFFSLKLHLLNSKNKNKFVISNKENIEYNLGKKKKELKDNEIIQQKEDLVNNFEKDYKILNIKT